MANPLTPGLRPGITSTKPKPSKPQAPNPVVPQPTFTGRALQKNTISIRTDRHHTTTEIHDIFKRGYPDRKALNPADVLTGYRANYKLNPQLWFNQGSSFLYQTLNRIPLVEESLNDTYLLELGETGKEQQGLLGLFERQNVNITLKTDTSSKPTNYVSYTRQPGDVICFHLRYFDANTREFEYRIDVTNHTGLINREIQYNLGLNMSRSRVQTYKSPHIDEKGKQEVQGNGNAEVSSMDFQKPNYVLRLNGESELVHPGENDKKTIVFRTQTIKTYPKLMQDYNSAYNPMFFGYRELAIDTNYPATQNVSRDQQGFHNRKLTYNSYLRYFTGNKYNSYLKLEGDQTPENDLIGSLDVKRFHKTTKSYIDGVSSSTSTPRLAYLPINSYDSYTYLLADTNRYVKFLGEGITYSRYNLTDYSPMGGDLQVKETLDSSYSKMIYPTLRNYSYPVLRKIHTEQRLKIYYPDALYTENYGDHVLDPNSSYLQSGRYEDQLTYGQNPRDLDGLFINSRNIPNDIFRIHTYYNRSHDGWFKYPIDYSRRKTGSREKPRPYNYTFSAFGKYGGIHNNNNFKISSPLDMLEHVDLNVWNFATINSLESSNIGPFRVSHPVNTIDMRSYLWYYEVRGDPFNPNLNHFINHMHMDVGPSIDMREYGVSQDTLALSDVVGIDRTPTRYISRVTGKNYYNINGAFNPIIEATTNQLHDSDYDQTFLAHILFSKPYGQRHLLDGLVNLNGSNRYELASNIEKQRLAFNDRKLSIFSGSYADQYKYPDQIQVYGYSRTQNEGHIVVPGEFNKYSLTNLMSWADSQEGFHFNPGLTHLDDFFRIAGSINYMMPFNSFMVFTPNQYMTSNNVYKTSNLNGTDKNTYHTTFGGYTNNPIQEFNTPINNGLEYRLGYNPSFRAGMGLSLLAEKGNLMKPGTIGDRDYLNSFGHNFTGWGNMAPYAIQKLRMRTTVCLTTNASYSKYSLFQRLLKNSHKLLRQNVRTNSFLEPVDHSGFIKNNITIDLNHPTDPQKNVVLDFILPSERFQKYNYVLNRQLRAESSVIFYTLQVTKMKNTVTRTLDTKMDDNVDNLAQRRYVSNEGRRLKYGDLYLESNASRELVYDDTYRDGTAEEYNLPNMIQNATYVEGAYVKTSSQTPTKYHFTQHKIKTSDVLFSCGKDILDPSTIHGTNWNYSSSDEVFPNQQLGGSMHFYRNSGLVFNNMGRIENSHLVYLYGKYKKHLFGKDRIFYLNTMDQTLKLFNAGTTTYGTKLTEVKHENNNTIQTLQQDLLPMVTESVPERGNYYRPFDRYRARNLHKVYNIERFVNTENDYDLQSHDRSLGDFEYELEYESEKEYRTFKETIKNKVIRDYKFLIQG